MNHSTQSGEIQQQEEVNDCSIQIGGAIVFQCYHRQLDTTTTNQPTTAPLVEFGGDDDKDIH
ncbi:hypothetical protein BLOT_007346 [Blomia tropicalis]|nr:hypothetical protein BLOT_007346 [Blomia tropicalis]